MVRDKKLILYNLYKDYYDMAYRRAYYILKNKTLAEDAVHEAFVIIYYKMDQLKNTDRIVPWMMTIVRNCALSQLNIQGKCAIINDFSCFQEQTYQQDLLDLIEEKEIRKEIINIINEELKEPYQHVIILRYYYNFSYEDIARLLNIKIGTVKSRIYRAKQIIARSLEKLQLFQHSDSLMKKVENFD